jgi:glycosyltransferase involved in cell wall biosynthesis
VLPYSIGSVLDQTFDDFELLVVGDGCTDESEDVVKAIDDSRVHWHNLPTNTKNQSAPNGAGLRLAAGDVIAYLGHDDLWLPHHLQVLVDTIDSGTSWARASMLSISPHGPPSIWPDAAVSLIRSQSARPSRQTDGTEPKAIMHLVAPCSLVHVRQLAIDAGGWRPLDAGTQSAPIDLWNRMASIAGPPRWVRRLTSVKIAAAARHDVYRQRPFHEQEYWLHRIRESHDPEATMRRACEEDYVFSVPTSPTMPGAPNSVGLRGLARRVRGRLARRGLVSPPPAPTREYMDTLRKFKGLDD